MLQTNTPDRQIYQAAIARVIEIRPDAELRGAADLLHQATATLPEARFYLNILARELLTRSRHPRLRQSPARAAAELAWNLATAGGR